MGAIQRQSRHSVHAVDESPLVLPHASYVGLGIIIPGTAVPTITVEVGGTIDGDFDEEVTMEGTGDWRWPDTDGMNRLYNARYIRITWDAGDIEVFQKG